MYVLDTSAILDGWSRYYPRDVFPHLWEALEDLIASGSIRCPDEVLEELKRKDDDVYRWARAQDGFFVPLEDGIQERTIEILTEFPKLVDTRRRRGQADPFVIAYAWHAGATLVTGERSPGTVGRPTIPFVCRRYGVTFKDLLGLMRQQGWSFGSPRPR